MKWRSETLFLTQCNVYMLEMAFLSCMHAGGWSRHGCTVKRRRRRAKSGKLEELLLSV